MKNVSLSVADDTWLPALVGRCQRLAGLAATQGESLTASIEELSAGMPEDLTPAQRLATRNLLTVAFARLSRVTGSERRPDVHSIFFDWANCDVTSPTWHRDVISFVDRCARALTRDGATTPSCLGDVRVARAVQMIESQYADENLSLTSVAPHASLSARHLARLLKHRTGLGFSELFCIARASPPRRRCWPKGP